MEMITLFYIGVFAVAFLLMCYAFYEAKKDTKAVLPTSPEKTIPIKQKPIIDYRFNEANEYVLNNFEEIIKSSALIDFNVFQVNDSYFVLNDKNQWIVDAGIEFQFYKGYFTIGFSTDLEHISVQSVKFDKMYTDDNYVALDNVKSGKLKAFIGKKIEEVTFKTLEFDEVIDYTMKTKKVSKLVEILLHFEGNQTLQIALVNYDLLENEVPKNFRYNLSNDILISMNAIVKIN
jgi:hypothetical protein